MEKKNLYKWIGNALLMLLAIVVSSATGVCMAAATAMGGETSDMEAGTTVVDSTGGSTATTGIEVTEDTDPDYYAKEIDKRITKMRPMRTPIDQITRKASTISRSGSMVVQYYSVATRPIRTTVKTQVTAMTSGQGSTTVQVDDGSIFSLTDTIRVVGVKGRWRDARHQGPDALRSGQE